MTEGIDLPAWAALLTALCLIVGAGLTFIGSLGLLRLKTFYQRLHAPTLGTTLGTGSILIGSMIYFSALGMGPVLHEIVIAVFVTVTTPVSFILLLRATQLRRTDQETTETAGSGSTTSGTL
jgi:multicomponent K+:H+ antiporter subunit G